jgi:polysaccharide biosynthesis transport protein
MPDTVPADQTPVEAAAAAPQEFHLKEYIAVVMSRIWVLFIFLTLVLSAAVAYNHFAVEQYEATACLEIVPTQARTVQVQGVMDPTQTGGVMSTSQEYLTTEYRQITELRILRPIFKDPRFKLYDHPVFKNNSNPIDSFKKRFTVAPIRNTRLVDVTFLWPDKAATAPILQAVLDRYRQDYTEKNSHAAREGIDSAKIQAEKLRDEVEKLEYDLQTLRREHRIVEDVLGTAANEARLNQLVVALEKINVEKTDVESQLRSLNSRIATNGHKPLEDPEVIRHPGISEMRLELAKAERNLAEIAKQYKEGHPAYVAAKNEVTVLEEKLSGLADQILAAQRAEQQAALQHLTAARQRQSIVENDLREYRTNQERFKHMADTAFNLRETYNGLRKRIVDLELASYTNISSGNIHVARAAESPEKAARPRRAFNLSIAAALGLLGGIGLCFFFEYFDTTLKNRQEIERLLARPILGFVPPHDRKTAEESPDLVAMHNSRSSMAEAFRTIRTAIAFSSTGAGGIRSFLVTSACPSEGKSLVAINVAISLAQDGKRVLLIDADLRKPRLHRTFNLRSPSGLSNYLVDEAHGPIAPYIQHTAIPNLDLIVAGPLPPNPAELLNGARLAALLAEVGAAYDRVIFDTPPVVNVSDSAILGARLDGVVFVVRAYKTQRELAVQAVRMLQSSRANVLGVVVNSIDTPRRGYYRDYYYYHRYYRSGTYYGSEGKETGAHEPIDKA